MKQKFWKKFQKSLLVVSIAPVSFRNFHWNHHKWENETKVSRITNFRGGKLTLSNWSWKSADVGLLYGPPAITIHRTFFLAINFFFCNKARSSGTQFVYNFRLFPRPGLNSHAADKIPTIFKLSYITKRGGKHSFTSSLRILIFNSSLQLLSSAGHELVLIELVVPFILP